MTFYSSQLGRFGALRRLVDASHGPDQCAAHLLAMDGDLATTRPSLHQLLAEKGFLHRNDPVWQTYEKAFAELVESFSGSISLLRPGCPPRPGLSSAMCVHELSPPLQHWTLRGFPAKGRHTVVMSAAGPQVDQSAKPYVNYVIDESGEILIGVEDYDWIKHSSLAAGLPAWAAGQLGLESGKLRLINLSSGHYVRMNLGTNVTDEQILRVFARDAFTLYCDHMGLDLLTTDFRCV